MCAVSYLNTVPLVWGLLHGPQRDEFDLSFALPAVCADQLRTGEVDIGIVPAVELIRQNLAIFPGAGICSRGQVRSILLISKVPIREIRTLATDSSSRTSVMLSRIILAECYGVEPDLVSLPPILDAMLAQADAALVIGDPALRLDPAALPYHVIDLGTEWTTLTGLPMVFAVWAGRKELVTERRVRAFVDSARFGMEHIDDIVQAEYERRGITRELAKQYLTENLILEMDEPELAGLERYLEYARKIEQQPATQRVTA